MVQLWKLEHIRDKHGHIVGLLLLEDYVPVY